MQPIQLGLIGPAEITCDCNGLHTIFLQIFSKFGMFYKIFEKDIVFLKKMF